MKFLNSQESAVKGAGNAFQRFYGRSPRLQLPGLDSYSIVDQQALNVRRIRAQEAVALKKGRGNAEQFKEGDSVRVCNIKLGVWDLKGIINKELPGEDGKVRTYEIILDDGTYVMCNGQFVHHRTGPTPL